MTNSKWYLLLLLGLIIMLLSSVIACNKNTPPDSITTYTNDNWGYSIKYPLGWEVIEIGLTTTNLQTIYKTRAGFISIFVLRNNNLPIETSVEYYISETEKKYTGFTLLANTRMQDSWDWYISYDFIDEYSREFHGETYFKQVFTRLYKIDTVGEKDEYDEYHFKQLVSTFTLLQ